MGLPRVLLWPFIAIVCQIRCANIVLPPVAADLDFTIDYRDEMRFEISRLFSIPTSDSLERLRVLITGIDRIPPGCCRDIPTATLIREKYYDGSLQERKTRLTLEIVDLQKIPREEFAIFKPYCLFAWIEDPMDDVPNVPIFTDDDCLELHLRVTNASLNHTDLPNMLGAGKLAFTTEAMVSNISMSTLTKGLLPVFINYHLDCKSSSSKLHAQGPKLVSNPKAFEVENLQDTERFVGEKQAHLNGYLIDYSLANRFFRVLRANNGHEIVAGVKPSHVCQQTYFYSILTKSREIFIICVGDQTLELIQIVAPEQPISSRSRGPSQAESTPTETPAVRIERTSFPGYFGYCRILKIKQILVCLEAEDPSLSSGQRSFNQRYHLLKVMTSPLVLLDWQSFSIDPFKRYYATKMQLDIATFSMELLNTFEPDRLVVSVATHDGWRHLVALRCENVFDQSCLQSNSLMIRNLSSLRYHTSQPAPTYCLTKSGTYTMSPDTKTVWFVPINSQSMMFTKDLTQIEGVQHRMVCYQDIGILLLDFLAPVSEGEYQVTTILMDSRIGTEMNKKDQATLVYRAWTKPDESPLVLSYYDWEARILATYGKRSTKDQLKFTISLQDPIYAIDVFDAGDFDCNLRGSDLTDTRKLPETVPVSIKVRERLGMPVIDFKNRFRLNSKNHKFNATISLDLIFDPNLPVHNAKVTIEPDQVLRSGLTTIYPRYRTKYFVEIPSEQSSCDQSIWIHNTLFVCTHGTELQIFMREETSEKFSLYAKYSILQDLVLLGTSYSVVHFEKLEDINFCYDNQKDPKLVFIWGMSNVFKKHVQLDSTIFYDRYFLIFAIRLQTFDSEGKMAVVLQFDSNSMDHRHWQMLNPKPDATGTLTFELHLLRRYSIQESKFYSEKVTVEYLPEIGFLNLQEEVFPIEVPVGSMYDGEYNFDELTNKTHFFSFITSEDYLRFVEFLFVPKSGWKFIQEQALSIHKLPGFLTAFVCSRVWELCILALDTHQLLEIPFKKDFKGVFEIQRPENDSYISYPLLAPGRVIKIDVGTHLMWLSTNDPNAGLYIFRKHHLDHPVSIIESEYQSNLEPDFGTDCPMVPESEACKSRELVVMVGVSNCIKVIELVPLTIELRDFEVDDHVTVLSINLQIRINDPELASEDSFSIPESLGRNYTLTIQGDLERLEKLPSEIYLPLLASTCIAILAFGALLCMNSFWYRHQKSKEVLGYLSNRNSVKSSATS